MTSSKMWLWIFCPQITLHDIPKMSQIGVNKADYNFDNNHKHQQLPLKTAEMKIFKTVPDARCLVLVGQVSF